jgi:hypothetical protein
MKPSTSSLTAHIGVAALLLAAPVAAVRADAITDWNIKAGQLIVESRLGTPPAIRVMAIAQTAVLDAVEEAARRQPSAPAASLDAAVAAANRAVLGKLLPSQQPSIDAAYREALEQIDDGPARASGVAIGERAAAAALARRADDGTLPGESYRPHTTPGAYVPTAAPAAPQWSKRRPWLMTDAAQFRPAAPPALTSATWARDYNEVKRVGAKTSSHRSAEQTEIARFWEYSLPPIYHGVVRSVAQMPGRDTLRNARLFAAVAQAMDDALISVFDAKYHYNFWRPSTAIRNGDVDGNEATEREPSWLPLIDAPLHPEYPSAHSILAAAVGTVLKADLRDSAAPALATTSPTAKGVTRRWSGVEEFISEVGLARIYEGIHYRTSVDVGTAMGREIGELAVARHFAGAAH